MTPVNPTAHCWTGEDAPCTGEIPLRTQRLLHVLVDRSTFYRLPDIRPFRAADAAIRADWYDMREIAAFSQTPE